MFYLPFYNGSTPTVGRSSDTSSKSAPSTSSPAPRSASSCDSNSSSNWPQAHRPALRQATHCRPSCRFANISATHFSVTLVPLSTTSEYSAPKWLPRLYSAEFGKTGAKAAALKRSPGRPEHKQEKKDVRAELTRKTKALEKALAELETYKHREEQQVENLKKLEIMLDEANVKNDGFKAEVNTLIQTFGER